MSQQESRSVEGSVEKVREDNIHQDVEKSSDRLSDSKTVYHHEHVADLSDAHREYLLRRHGTVDLEPIPDMNDADPYNWPTSKAMMATFIAASIQSSFEDISVDLDISIQTASYLTSLAIAILGGAPLFWRPLSDRYGRRPIFILSLFCSLAGNIGCANSPTYATMAACRAITAFFISPALAIGSAVVVETFFKKDRARSLGVWTLLVTLGIPVAPLLMGFVAYRVGYRWIYYVLAITNAVQLLLYIPFGPETLYLRGKRASIPTVHKDTQTLRQKYLTFGRIDPTPFRTYDFFHPLSLFCRPCVFIPTAAYSMVFLLANILIAIEIPQLFVQDFDLNTEQVGLQYISVIIGAVIGEQLGGITSDKWMQLRQRRRQRSGGTPPAYEFRLWLAYPGFLLAIVGVVVFLVQIGDAGAQWNVTPLVGAAIASVGNQLVTTVVVTYVVDCYRDDAASVGVFITFVRQIWGFIGPFWFPSMIEGIGLGGSAGVCVALMVGASVFPTALVQWRGGRWRSAGGGMR